MENYLQFLRLLDQSHDSADAQSSQYCGATAELHIDWRYLEQEKRERENNDSEIKNVPRVSEVQRLLGDKLDHGFQSEYTSEHVIENLLYHVQLIWLVKPQKCHDYSVEHDAGHDEVFEPDTLRNFYAYSSQALISVTSEQR